MMRSSLEQLRAVQHDDVVLASDHALLAFLAELTPEQARHDLEPVTAVERRHLAHARRTAA